MVETAVLFGANRTLAQKELMQVIDFEVALAKVSLISHLNFVRFHFIVIIFNRRPYGTVA